MRDRHRHSPSFLPVSGVDSKLSNTILNEIIDVGPNVLFDDVAGQQAAKQVSQIAL